MLCCYRINKKTTDVVAIKIIDLEEAEDEIEDIQQEITILSQCDSPYVTKYHGSYLKVPYIRLLIDHTFVLCIYFLMQLLISYELFFNLTGWALQYVFPLLYG